MKNDKLLQYPSLHQENLMLFKEQLSYSMHHLNYQIMMFLHQYLSIKITIINFIIFYL